MAGFTERQDWFSNKIKGGLAEAVCRSHFEALGYTVENFGIENIAPQYALITRNPNPGPFLSEFKNNLQNMPDFLISGTYPSGAVGLAGQTEALLVDAKYREDVNLTDFHNDIKKEYSNLIERGISFMIYLVSKRYRTNGHVKNTKKQTDNKSFVHIGLYRKEEVERPWLTARETSLLHFPLTYGRDETENFNTVYDDIVHPCLTQIFASK